MCLEFSTVTQPGLRELYDLYSFAVRRSQGQSLSAQRHTAARPPRACHAPPRVKVGRVCVQVIPRVGGLVANDAESYQYLVESIRKFPDQVLPGASHRAGVARTCCG
jgi:ubiquinone/menaquinone biosynthesis C-methylase UbiE